MSGDDATLPLNMEGLLEENLDEGYLSDELKKKGFKNSELDLPKDLKPDLCLPDLPKDFKPDLCFPDPSESPVAPIPRQSMPPSRKDSKRVCPSPLCT